jgi:hypothetical protein
LEPTELSPQCYEEGGRGVLTLDDALAFLPAVDLEASDARLAANGNRLRGLRPGRFRAYGESRLLGIYESEGESARPLVVFPEGV